MAATASKAPANCITMNIGTESGWIPAKLSDSVRVTDTAGLANDVDEVKRDDARRGSFGGFCVHALTLRLLRERAALADVPNCDDAQAIRQQRIDDVAGRGFPVLLKMALERGRKRNGLAFAQEADLASRDGRAENA